MNIRLKEGVPMVPEVADMKGDRAASNVTYLQDNFCHRPIGNILSAASQHRGLLLVQTKSGKRYIFGPRRKKTSDENLLMDYYMW